MRAGLLMAIGAMFALGIGSPTDTGSRSHVAKAPSTVVAMRYAGRSSVELLRVDRRTFTPVGTRRVELGQNPGAWALSRDGKQLAVGSEEALGLRIVDLTRMRRTVDVKTRNGLILGAAWLTPRRIVGVEETGLFDTLSWSVRTLEPRANGIGFAAGTIVATRHGFEVGRGIGVVGFARDGTRRFHLLGDVRMSILQALDDRVFLRDERRTRAADVRRGRVVPAPQNLPQLLVGNMQRY